MTGVSCLASRFTQAAWLARRTTEFWQRGREGRQLGIGFPARLATRDACAVRPPAEFAGVAQPNWRGADEVFLGVVGKIDAVLGPGSATVLDDGGTRGGGVSRNRVPTGR